MNNLHIKRQKGNKGRQQLANLKKFEAKVGISFEKLDQKYKSKWF